MLNIENLSNEELLNIDFKLTRRNSTRNDIIISNLYDTKAASHVIRLYLECLELMIEKTLTFPLPQNNLVRDIKLGKYSLDEVLSKAEHLEKLVDEAYLKTSLPNAPDFNFLNDFQIQLLEEYWEDNE
jgi:hypothetical protein